MNKKVLRLKGKNIEDVVNAEEHTSKGIQWFQNGDEVKVFYPADQKAPVMFADGNKGSGKPGTMQWHKTQLAQMKVKEIQTYVKEATGGTISIYGGIVAVRKKALAVLNDNS